MKKILSILFIALFLMSSCFALAEQSTSDIIPTKLTDFDIVFGLPEGMEPVENNATINEDGVPYFGFITPDKRMKVEFYGTKYKDLSEAEAWAVEHIGSQITKQNVIINGLKAIEYHFAHTSEDGTVTYTDVVFAVNDAGEIFEFWEYTLDEDNSGHLSSELYPVSFFKEVDTSGDTKEEAPATEQKEEAPAAGSASGVCTANQVNLRAEPNANARPLGQINKGEKLVLLETDGDWTKVSCSKGEGYIKTQYIEVQ